MHAVADMPLAACHDVADGCFHRTEDRAVEQRIAPPLPLRRIGLIEHDPVGPVPGGDGADALPEGLGAAAAGGPVEAPAERFRAGEPEYVALLVLDALPIFEKAQLEKRIDVDMAIAADAEAAIARKKSLGAEQAVAEIAFGRRAQSGD